MEYLTAPERAHIIGPYHAPQGLYEYTRTLPFTGRVTSNKSSITAGEWTEILLEYEVGASGLADGAWIKATFKFYSDWALFQTSDPTAENYVSVEYIPNALFAEQEPATVQSLGIRFDQKGHERPFQKAVIVDVHDGYLNPGDKILIRLGDTRFGGKGTRAQTFVERDFRWRFYIDPVGTSRFAPIQPDLSWDIVPGAVKKIQAVSPRLLRPDVPFAIHAHAEDEWGNVTRELDGLDFHLQISDGKQTVLERTASSPSKGWTNVIFADLSLPTDGDYILITTLTRHDETIASSTTHLTISSDLSIPKVLFGDLHVHSDDTVGTESSLYNFTYGRDISALDVLGYTANDFQITQKAWKDTVSLIKSLNQPGKFVLYPGTEWCGNSAAGGDHNVVFLGNPDSEIEFPFDKHGNVARSFEWSEHGPKDLTPGAWPLDELYATYAHDADSHLLIPHVGGRRCNLSWHHPNLERLVEIGSAWGQFEWLVRDAVRRGWKMGVCANSDEHRGRCGGGVPGSAVFGTRGGLAGILAGEVTREGVATALRARRTFATTGQRLVGLIWTGNEAGDGPGDGVQGDEVLTEEVKINYHFLGERGFSSIEAFDASGMIWSRRFWSESNRPATILRVTWGGARLYDRYREAIWKGEIALTGPKATGIVPFGGLEDNPEDYVRKDNQGITFSSKTSGDLDGVNIFTETEDLKDATVTVSGSIGGYVKVGDPLAGNPHKPQPTFTLEASWAEATNPGGKMIEIKGGAELFVRVEAIPEVELPRRVQGTVTLESRAESKDRAVYFVGREWSGGKVVTSPIFFTR
ncbi:hypothetical protein BDV18DRAFT_167157 [Aspergillus unguis]